MTNTKTKYLVTGSSGFLGYHFINFLNNNHIKANGVYNLNKPKLAHSSKHIKFIKCDLLKTREVSVLPKAQNVVHFAAIVAGKDKIYINHRITENIVKYCNSNKSRLIFISSSQVLYSINNSYITSKKKSEKYIKKNSGLYTIIRPAAPYGKPIKQFRLGRKQPLHILAKATKYPIIPVIGSGNNTRQPLFSEDLNKFILLVSSDKGSIRKTYNIAGPEVLTYNQIIDIILKTKNRKAIKIHLPISIAKIMAIFLTFTDPENIVASTTNENVENNCYKRFKLSLTYFKNGCKSLG